MQEFALLQSTFFALQQQQMMQMKLLQELQSQMDSDPDVDASVSQEVIKEQYDDIEKKIKESKIPVNEVRLEATTLPKKEEVLKEAAPPIPNFSLAESIIMNPDEPLNSCSQISSLEMLQKRTQEVLDNATQSLSNGSLTEELAYRREYNGNEPHFKHRCRYCGKIFGSDSALQIHLRSHTGERPFKCDMCSSSFTTKGNLKVHYQRHTLPNYPPGHPLNNERMSMPGKDDQGSSPGLPTVGGVRFPFPPGFGFPGLPLPFPRPPLELLEKLRLDVFNNVQLVQEQVKQQEHFIRQIKGVKEEITEKRSESPVPIIKRDDPLQSLEDCVAKKRPKFDSPNSIESEQESRLRSLRSHKSPQELPPPKSPEKRASPKTPTTPPSIGQSPINYNIVLPRFGSKDRTWEKFIEVTKTSETSKLQQLVDNIEHKLQDPNECPICHKVLSCKSSLLMHYRIHTGEKPFRCKICGRPFSTKGNLKVHMSIHRIKEPFAGFNACPICHQKFSNIFSLQEHIRSHTEGMNDHDIMNMEDYDQSVDYSLSSSGIDDESMNDLNDNNDEVLDLAMSQAREHDDECEEDKGEFISLFIMC